MVDTASAFSRQSNQRLSDHDERRVLRRPPPPQVTRSFGLPANMRGKTGLTRGRGRSRGKVRPFPDTVRETSSASPGILARLATPSQADVMRGDS